MAFETSAGTDGLGSHNNLPRHLEPDLTLKNRSIRKSNGSCIYCERQETNKGSWFASAIFMYVNCDQIPIYKLTTMGTTLSVSYMNHKRSCLGH